MSWEHDEALCSRRGESLRYRIAYLEGTLEIGMCSGDGDIPLFLRVADDHEVDKASLLN